jgi:uncharacterized membrane protein
MTSTETINRSAQNTLLEGQKGQQVEHSRTRSALNINQTERMASAVAGGALAVIGIARGGWCGLLMALTGGGLVYRGATGHCGVYQALGVDTSDKQSGRVSVRHNRGIKIEKSMTITKSPEELYTFWRNFSNLPRFMNHLESVTELDGKRSHWVAKAPAGMTVEWDAEIINEEKNELIAWRSLEGATVPNAGSIRFEPAPANRGCVVRVSLSYEPPGGALGSKIAKLFGEEPGQQIEEDLRRFKQLMETGEIASTDVQPSGRAAAHSGTR